MLFALGVAGFLFRRNIITVFMSIELMLNAVNLSFITFSYQLKQVNGHIFVFFVMVVAAAEAAVGLAIILTVFKNRETLEYRRSQLDEELTARPMQLWLIPILPLAGFPINGLFGRRFSKAVINAVAIGSVLLSFAWVLKTLFGLRRSRTPPTPSIISPGFRAARSLSAAISPSTGLPPSCC